MFSQENYIEVLTFAAIAHGEQKTPKGLPYLAHITCVAMEVINACEKSNLDEEKSNIAISFAWKLKYFSGAFKVKAIVTPSLLPNKETLFSFLVKIKVDWILQIVFTADTYSFLNSKFSFFTHLPLTTLCVFLNWLIAIAQPFFSLSFLYEKYYYL